MDLKTIRQVSLEHDISRRMLCYYEEIGLIKSSRIDDYAYRVYDEYAIMRLQQIIFLRKLQIPMKQIKGILENQNAIEIIEIFKQNISKLDEQITALSAVRSILSRFVEELQEKADVHLNLELLKDNTMLSIVGSLSFSQNKLKEKTSMEELSKAAKVLNKLKSVKVVYVPPMTVASIYCAEEESYEKVWQAISDFVKQANILEIKPDLRVFRISYINPFRKKVEIETWVSVPDDFNIPLPFIKKNFLGGQYAAHLSEDDDRVGVAIGIYDWINESEKYRHDTSLERCSPPFIEIDGYGGIINAMDEVLNFYNDQSFPEESRIEKLVAVADYTLSDEMPMEIPEATEKFGFKASIVTKNKFRIMGFTQISTHIIFLNEFRDELKKDGRLDILKKYRKPGAPILIFNSYDLDSRMRGGSRNTICLAESDVTDIEAFMAHDLYTEKIDASKWLIWECKKIEHFYNSDICPMLGYAWNRTAGGIFIATPDCETWEDGDLWKSRASDKETVKSDVYFWCPVK